MKWMYICWIFLVFGIFFEASSNGNVTYYVTNRRSNSTCPGQPCKSLFYYINNAEKLFNRQENITMKFLRGIHSSYCFESVTTTISTPNVALIGEGPQATRVHCMDLHFNNTTKLYISQLKMAVWNLTITSASSKLPNNAYLRSELWILSVEMAHGTSAIGVRDITNVKILNTTGLQHYITIRGPSTEAVEWSKCTFSNGIRTTFASMREANITVRDCTFISSPVFVYNTKIIFAGTSTLTGSRTSSAIFSISATIVLSGSVSFMDNSAFRGGAMALYSSLIIISPGANVTFVNNSAYGEGGAVYIDLGLTKNVLLRKISIEAVCFYQLLDCHENSSYNFHFANNSAEKGGNDMYGVSLQSSCEYPGNGNCRLHVTALQGMPSVSSDPTRVCICDNEGRPQCINKLYIMLRRQLRPGEIFTLPVMVVGGDFGPTVGVVYTTLSSSSIHLTTSSQYNRLLTTNKYCTKLNYSIYSNSTNNKHTNMQLSAYTGSDIPSKSVTLSECIKRDYCIRTRSVEISISLLPCPQGFTLLGEPPICDCYPELSASGIECKIINGEEIFSWQGSLWVVIEQEGVLYGSQCPSNYCKINRKEINLQRESDAQCMFNRAGRLCGGCRENHSLAIGSSHCIQCHNNNNLALLIFFAAVGFLLVCFINTFNLTVTQGMVNGIIFYANIVWTYQGIFFANNEAENTAMIFLKTFVAWVNLDFGIETCFVDGLTAFWKTWLEFIFPFYIWGIAGLIVAATRYSSRLTRIFGSKAVHVLTTLILLSYMKLLNTAVSALEFSFLTYSEYPQNSSKSVVWSVDANLAYLGFPHVLLFLASLATLLFLWLPYTLLLLLIPWLRKLPNWRILKKIMQLHPVYDAYLAPFKHTHQYFCGLLLLVRGALLITFASTLGISAPVNLFLLLILEVMLLVYVALVKPYKSVVIFCLQLINLANLTALSGFFFLSYTQSNGSKLQVIAIGISTGVVFLQFCGIVLHSLITKCMSRCSRDIVKADEGDIHYAYVHVGTQNSQL